MKRNTSRKAEEAYLAETLRVVRDNVREYGQEVAKMQEDIDEMLEHYHDNDTEVLTILNNTVTMHTHMKRALERNEKALKKPYFGRIVFHDEALNKEESLKRLRMIASVFSVYNPMLVFSPWSRNIFSGEVAGQTAYPSGVFSRTL